MKNLFAIACMALAFGLGAEVPPPMPTEFLASPAEVWRSSREVTAKRFPDADSVMIDDRIHTAYEPDGSSVTWDDEWVKVLTEKGRRANATVSLDVSLRYGDAAIELVEIVGTNGVTRKVDFNRTLKMATDNSSVAANIYDPLDKRITCAVSGLAVGEIRHVRFCRRERKARMKGTWADSELLEYTAPIVHTLVSVDAPPQLPIRHAAVRHPFKDTVRRLPDRPLAGGRRLLAWEARNVPQVFTEPAMPPLASEVQSLRLSTVPDWPTISRWYWELCRPRLAASSPAITNRVAELTASCASDLEKVRALFRFVSQEIRYMGLTDEADAPGYEPHDVKLTFDNRYGVCRDKAALLVEMLAIAGFRARPVLIHAGRKMDPEIPSPYFNHAITAVKLAADGEWTLMDPTDEISRDLLPSYLSDCSYLVADPAGEPLRVSPITPLERNLLKVTSEGSLSSDGSALLTTRIAFGGINDTAARHLFGKKTERDRRRAFETILRRVSPGAELLSCEITPSNLQDTDTEMSLVAIARFPDIVLNGSTRDELELPFITRAFSVVNVLLERNTALEKRRFPLEFDFTAGTDETVTIKLGEALGELVSLPPESRVGEGAGYECHRSFAVDGDRLTARRRQLLRNIRFEVPAYEQLRDNLKLDEAAVRAQPVFAVNENANADVRIRLNRREVCFFSPRSWVETNTVEKEILTYAGKKRSAELKFYYSPVTRTVELLSATVSNRNGRVYAITPKEMNVLDASWAAAAPRYPASKTLVANLPGVEIGSVVRYQLAIAVTNSPLDYTSFTVFDSSEVQERKTVKYSVPDGMAFKTRTTNFDSPGLVALSDRVGGRRRFAWSAKSLPRAPQEPSQPAASFWRPTLFVTTANWHDYAEAMAGGLASARAACADHARAKAVKLVEGCTNAAERISAIRRYLAHNVRIVGPGLFELPFDQAFTPPDRSLAEGYASVADYRNLTCVMLEAAGFECSLVFAADDSHGLKSITRRYQDELPRPDFFDALVLRARMDGRTYYLTGENEFTPVNCSVREGDTIFDPDTLDFGEVRLEEADDRAWYAPWTWFKDPVAAEPGSSQWSSRDVNFARIMVREDGGADFDITNRQYGVSVGSFRKRFAEMLPERRSRYYQSLLGNLADSATATRELSTDIESYPATTAYSAFVPEYATAQGGVITVRVPDFDEGFLAVGAFTRKSPIATGIATEEDTIREVVFPKGFTEIEHLPEAYVLKDPATGRPWVEFAVTTRIEERRLTVTLHQHVHRRIDSVLGPDYFPFFQEWNRRMSSLAGRTISVRRKGL